MDEEKKKEYFIVKVGKSSFIGLNWKPIEKNVAYGIDVIDPVINDYIIHLDVDKNNKPLNIISIPKVNDIDDFVKKMPEYKYKKDDNGNDVEVKYIITDTAFSGCVGNIVGNYKKSLQKGSKKGKKCKKVSKKGKKYSKK